MSEHDPGGVRAIAAKLVQALLGRRAADETRDPDFDSEVGESDRRELIAQAAYELAAERDFAPGKVLDDWLAAEAAVDDELRALPRGR